MKHGDFKWDDESGAYKKIEKPKDKVQVTYRLYTIPLVIEVAQDEDPNEVARKMLSKRFSDIDWIDDWEIEELNFE